MFSEFIGKYVTVIISPRSNQLLEYTGTLESENDYNLVLTGVDITYLMLNFERGLLGHNIGNSMTQFKKGLNKVIINKKYVISCNG